MNIIPFRKEHLIEARKIALENYCEEKVKCPELPNILEVPQLDYFAENGLGVVAFFKLISDHSKIKLKAFGTIRNYMELCAVYLWKYKNA